VATALRPLAALTALLLATLLVYAPVGGYDFAGFDDDGYLLENPELARGLSGSGVAWAFTTTRMSNWHPLTWLSYLLDHQRAGLSAPAFHRSSLALHALNVALLFAALARLTRAPWRSLLVAALFALHPLHVESVAWISERKDVLCGAFAFAALLAYARYAERPGLGRYAAVLLCLALGLMAKPMLVTLPFVLLLLDFWPLGRTGSGRRVEARRALALVAEKLPLLALSAAASAVTLAVQSAAVSDHVPLALRAANAALAYVAYLRRAVWPADLAPMYPHPGAAVELGPALAAGLALAAVTALALRAARAYPYLAVGWLWFLGTLVPVIGLVQVGVQAMADRYAYLPFVGLYLCAAWGGADLARALRVDARIAVAAALAALVAFAVATSRQLPHWRDAEALYARAVAASPADPWGHFNLGTLRFEQGRRDESIALLAEAIRLDPDYYSARVNLARALLDSDRVAEAMEHLHEAVRLAPDDAQARFNLGNAFARQGALDRAIPELERALALAPDLLEARLSLAAALALAGQRERAAAVLQEGLRARPDDPALRALAERIGGAPAP
jgi:tetratricopeptide (TPR) repeat protein